jgi:hypothetical protein
MENVVIADDAIRSALDYLPDVASKVQRPS